MRKIIALILIFATLYSGFAQKMVGVTPATGTADEGIKAAITDALTEGVFNSGFKVVERSQFEKLMKEQQLQSSDLIDDNTQVEFGALLGADYVCLSSVNKIAQNYLISYRLVEVKTGTIVMKDKKTATETDIMEVILSLSEEKLFTLKDNAATTIFCGVEIQKSDLKSSETCGYGWRLPTITELKCMYENRKEIGNFLFGEYLSRETRDGFQQGVRFSSGTQTNIIGKGLIRCVKDL